MALNKFLFTGNIGQDATARPIEGGAIAIGFTVAITEKYKDKQGNTHENTTWANCTKWVQAGGSTAIVPYLKKGIKVLIEGKPSARAYTKQDGSTAASLEVRVDTIELMGQPQQGTQQTAPQGGYQHTAPPQQPQPQVYTPQHPLAAQAAAYPTTQWPAGSQDDDLPF